MRLAGALAHGAGEAHGYTADEFGHQAQTMRNGKDESRRYSSRPEVGGCVWPSRMEDLLSDAVFKTDMFRFDGKLGECGR
jgi:hypothetical protein